MNKKIIALMMSCALVFGFFGCGTDTNTTKNNANTNYNNSTLNDDMEDMGSTTVDPTYPYNFDYNGNYRSNVNSNIGYINATGHDYYEGTDVYTKIKRMKKVDDVKIVIRDRHAYVGVKTRNNKKLTEVERRRIKTIIKRRYSRVRNVYFSRDRKGYSTLGDRIENGLTDITDDVLNLFDLR